MTIPENQFQITADKHSDKYYESTLLSLLEDKEFIDSQKTQNKYHENTKKTALIIDPRWDTIMEAVINNFMYYMNPEGWNLMIMTCSIYEEEVKNKFPYCIFRAIDPVNLYYDETTKTQNMHIETYNQLLMTRDFWISLPGSRITIFQKDCIMIRMFEKYYDFYDYAGPNYDHVLLFHEDDKKLYLLNSKAMFYGGINGGFSIRNKATMIECLEKITWDNIEKYRQIIKDILGNPEESCEGIPIIKMIYKRNEDIFFSHACEMLKKEVPDKIHRIFLAIEGHFCLNTCVYHGWNKNYHTIEDAKHLLAQSTLFSKYIKKESIHV